MHTKARTRVSCRHPEDVCAKQYHCCPESGQIWSLPSERWAKDLARSPVLGPRGRAAAGAALPRACGRWYDPGAGACGRRRYSPDARLLPQMTADAGADPRAADLQPRGAAGFGHPARGPRLPHGQHGPFAKNGQQCSWPRRDLRRGSPAVVTGTGQPVAWPSTGAGPRRGQATSVGAGAVSPPSFSCCVWTLRKGAGWQG